MRGVPLDQRIRRVLTVTLDADMQLTTSSTASAYFPAHVQQPQGEPSTADISPRQGVPASTLWLGPRPPVTLGPCDRIEADGTVYELIAAPREVTSGRSTIGHRALVLPIADLYPRSADVYELGGEKALGTVECALFSLASRSAPRGDYRDAFFEAPPTALSLLEGADNRELRFDGGETWRLRDPSLSREVPIVTATVTKAS